MVAQLVERSPQRSVVGSNLTQGPGRSFCLVCHVCNLQSHDNNSQHSLSRNKDTLDYKHTQILN